MYLFVKWDVLLICIALPQAPTPRQVRYKEKVMEMRKRRDSGLTKDQKEKYMVIASFQ